MNYIFIENGKIYGAGQCPIADDTIQNIEVSDEIFNEFLEDKLKYAYINGEIVPNPEYETLKEKEHIKEQIREIDEKLTVLDLKRIRAVCEDEIRNEKTGETWLDFYNSQIYDLRIQLQSLEEKL